MRKRRNEADLASTRRCVIGIRSSAPVNALAHWLVLRWEICGETPPDFRRRSSWYTTKMLPGKLSLSRKEISDDTQRNSLQTNPEASFKPCQSCHLFHPVQVSETLTSNLSTLLPQPNCKKKTPWPRKDPKGQACETTRRHIDLIRLSWVHG